MSSKLKNKFSKKLAPAYLILISSILLTLFASAYIWYNSYEKDQLRFSASIKQIQAKLTDRMEIYSGMLKATSGMFAVKEDISEDEFSLFIRKSEVLNRFPGIEGIGYAKKFTSQDKQLILDLKVYPDYARDIYYPALYGVSANNQPKPAGSFDIYTDEVRRSAMDVSLDRGNSQTSAKVVLISDKENNNNQSSFIMYYPVFRDGVIPDSIDDRKKNIIGYLYATFRMNNFIASTLKDYTDDIEISIYDGSVINKDNLMYTNSSERDAAVSLNNLAEINTFSNQGHNWTISYNSNSNFLNGSDRRFLPLSLMLGLFFSILIYMAVRNQILLREEGDERIRDIKSSQDLLVKSENLKDTILNSINSHIAVLDNKGKIIAVNKAWRKFYNQNGGALYFNWMRVNYLSVLESAISSGSKVVDSDKNLTASIYAGIKKVMNKEQPIFSSEYLFKLENKDLWFLIEVMPMTYPSQGVVISHTDITERKELENQKEEFIGIASHELKTPVTSIKAYAQVLQKRFVKAGDAHSASLVSKMDTQLSKLTKLITELLDATRIDAGKIEFNLETFDVDYWVKEVIEEMQRISASHQIIKRGNIKSIIRADKDRTGQVLLNLMSNAIKYSPNSDKIFVDVSVENDKLKIAVEDFGIGIPEKDRDKIFQRFHRVNDDAHHTFSGLGLGLFIASEIIKRQNGEIVMTAKGDNKGTIFYFTLPF